MTTTTFGVYALWAARAVAGPSRSMSAHAANVQRKDKVRRGGRDMAGWVIMMCPEDPRGTPAGPSIRGCYERTLLPTR